MPHRTSHQQGNKFSGDDRAATKKQQLEKQPEKRGGKPVDEGRERAKMGSEQPGYESLDENRAIGGARGEHRADPERMSRKQRGAPGAQVDQGEDIDDAPPRGEGRGIGHASGGVLSEDDNEGRSGPGKANRTTGSRRPVR